MTWSSAFGDIAFLSVFVAGMIALKAATWMLADKESWSGFLDLALQCTVVVQAILVGGLFSLWLVGALGPAHIVLALLGLGFLVVIFQPQAEAGNRLRK
ncbi:MAG TPA: hypothetical protein VH678_15630 [Xanthobacteraceae bacterium]|jgi:hypothetical protein